MKILKISLFSLAVLLILLIAAAWIAVWRYAGQNTVPPGVAAGQLQLGELPVHVALERLEQYELSLLERRITVEANEAAHDSISLSAGELGYKAQFPGLREALLKLQEGSAWDRALYRYHFDFESQFEQSWGLAALEAAVRKQWEWIEYNEPANATRTITDGDQVVYEPHQVAYRLELASLLKQTDLWLAISKEEAGARLEGTRKDFTAVLPIRELEPEVTLEELKDEGIERMIMSFTTDFATSAEGRAHNVTVTAETLGDWHLAPDEVFSYHELIQLAEQHHEYREAPVILNGKLVPGIGGGICQVSSTLYQAVLRAGIEIVERRNHSLPVAYLPLGHDATYAGGVIDFKFRNSTGKHLIIKTEVENRKVTVKLFGTMPENETYEIESFTLDTIVPKTQQTVNASLAPGKTIVVDKGRSGYVVETYRIHKRDGELVSRDRISRDTYRAQPVVLEVGPAVSGDGDGARIGASAAPGGEDVSDGARRGGGDASDGTRRGGGEFSPAPAPNAPLDGSVVPAPTPTPVPEPMTAPLPSGSILEDGLM